MMIILNNKNRVLHRSSATFQKLRERGLQVFLKGDIFFNIKGDILNMEGFTTSFRNLENQEAAIILLCD
jgi:hypothetical protein